MKTPKSLQRSSQPMLLGSLAAALLLGAAATSVRAEIVYVTACVSNCTSTTVCGSGANADLNAIGYKVYDDEGGYGAYTSAKAGITDKAVVPGARYHSNSFSNSTPDLGIVLSPSLAVTGGIYKVYHVFSSTAGNVSSNLIVGFTNIEGCTLSWTTTDKFQTKYGTSPQSWQLLGYITNNADTSFPRIRLYFIGGMVNAGLQNRLLIEQFKFQYYEPCTDIPSVGVTGPLGVSSGQVVVTGVNSNATNVVVYQDSGSGMAPIGRLVTGVVPGNNTVPVTGLVKGAKIAATQQINGTEGCKPQDGFGVTVGGGANPRLRLALSIKENPTATGPVGTNGSAGANSNIHFIPATNTLAGAAPGDGAIVLYPSNDWQTVTVLRGNVTVGDSANVAGTVVAGEGYAANDNVDLQVYAYKNIPAMGLAVYSATPAQSTTTMTSANGFKVNWTWSAVPGADGYRLLRQLNFMGFIDYVDVTNSTTYLDGNTAWTFGSTVTPTSSQAMHSITWNGTGTPDSIPGDWGVLEAIALVNDDETDTGPFDIYIDNLANGTNGVFQDFEGFLAKTAAGVVFNQPSYSGTTSGFLLTAPNVADISNGAADGGTKSIRVRWQFNSSATNMWMRFNTFNTSVMPNPLVDLNQPISFRILIQPVGSTPVPPPQPVITATSVGGQAVLNWTGTHQLQSALTVDGPYANVAGVTRGPYTNTFSDAARFFRLVN